MTRSSTESESEADGGNFLDLDSYLNKSHAQHAKDQLVVDAGKAAVTAEDCVSGSSSTSSAQRQKKQLSNDSVLSHTTLHHHWYTFSYLSSSAVPRRNKVNDSTDKTTRRVTCSESTRKTKPNYAPSSKCTNHTERRSRAHSIITERSSKHTIRQKRKANERRPSTITDFSTESYSKSQSDISIDQIIMSTLEELYRLLAERRSLPTTLPALRQKSSGSGTISEVTHTYTTQTRQSNLRKGSERGRRTGVTGRGGECIVAYALNDSSQRPKVIDESSGESQDGVTPGGFHLDDPVRLYQQAKQLQVPFGDRPSSSICPDSTSSPPPTPKRHSHPPTLCALCRYYWRVARRYLSTHTGGVGV